MAFSSILFFGTPDDLPKGTLFRNPFGLGPLQGPLSLRDNGGFGFVFVSEKNFFYTFINAKSTVSQCNNTIELKVYIYECIFWGCSVDTFWEDIGGFLKECYGFPDTVFVLPASVSGPKEANTWNDTIDRTIGEWNLWLALKQSLS
jgi:hypothetical protein